MIKNKNQMTLWNLLPEKPVWNDVRLPEEYHAFFVKTGTCPNCRQLLRHPMHALNHYKKFHMKSKTLFFVWNFGMWNEVPKKTYLSARKSTQHKKATARTK